jgi:hypothetical protein
MRYLSLFLLLMAFAVILSIRERRTLLWKSTIHKK